MAWSNQSVQRDTRTTQFEWDEAKSLVNIQKHGIENEMLIEPDERFDYDEDRWIGIGFLGLGVVVVAWAERHRDLIRIISARRASRHEWKRFEQYLSY